MWKHIVWNFLVDEGYELMEWSKCGEDYVSTVPTLLWALGASALAHRLLVIMFHRFMFRRVPLWEQILQHLLFIWMVMYSLYFWKFLMRIVYSFVEYYYYDDEEKLLDDEYLTKQSLVQQCLAWLCGVTPLAVYVYTRPRPSAPPLMIWITTNPWQRREMGPYGYYLNRPFSTRPSSTGVSLREQSLTLRRAFSDTKIMIKEPPKKRRHSKSI